MTFSNRRLAHARKAIKLDQERNALTPELVAYTTPEQRLEAMERSNAQYAAKWNAHAKATRHKAAAALVAMPKPRRRAALKWARKVYPHDATYLLSYLAQVNRGRSPFRDLRASMLAGLIRDGRIPLTFPRWRAICEAFVDNRRPRDPVLTKIRAERHARPQQAALKGIL